MTRSRSQPLIVLAVAGVALVAAPATAGTRKTVKVEDNFYLPAKATVNPGTTIAWTWPEDGGDVHDVKLAKAPKGVKKFQSDPGSSGFVFRRKLTKAGTYRFVCTLHEEMEMTVTVRRKR
jgi:plastocyanin